MVAQEIEGNIHLLRIDDATFAAHNRLNKITVLDCELAG
jgi:hypothetical protein